MSSIKHFLNKHEDLAKELVRCGSCSNSLVHCGKYEIVKVNNYNEGILCETCKNNNRELVFVTRISDDNNHVFQVPISQLDISQKDTTRAEKQNQKNNMLVV